MIWDAWLETPEKAFSLSENICSWNPSELDLKKHLQEIKNSLEITPIRIWLFNVTEKPRIAEDSGFGIPCAWDLNYLYASFNLGILRTCLCMLEVSVPLPRLVARPSRWNIPAEQSHYEVIQAEVTWGFLNSAIQNVPHCNDPQTLLSPYGSQSYSGRL